MGNPYTNASVKLRPDMHQHSCAGSTKLVVHLEQLEVVLNMPYRWLRDSYTSQQLMAIQEEVESIEEQLRRENRCIRCGLKMR